MTLHRDAVSYSCMVFRFTCFPANSINKCNSIGHFNAQLHWTCLGNCINNSKCIVVHVYVILWQYSQQKGALQNISLSLSVSINNSKCIIVHVYDIVAVLTTEGCIAEHFPKSKAPAPP